jgi:hypothetical protein
MLLFGNSEPGRCNPQDPGSVDNGRENGFLVGTKPLSVWKPTASFEWEPAAAQAFVVKMTLAEREREAEREIERDIERERETKRQRERERAHIIK